MTEPVFYPYYGTLIGSVNPQPQGDRAVYTGILDPSTGLLNAGWTAQVYQGDRLVSSAASNDLPLDPAKYSATYAGGVGALSSAASMQAAASGYLGSAIGGSSLISPGAGGAYVSGIGAGSGAAAVGGAPPVAGSGGTTLPGGSAGALNATQRAAGAGSSALAGLSHTTAGLNWTHLALWLAILAGAYIVLDGLVGGKHKRRR